MLTQIHIQNFKGFKDTQIPSVRKVNLILGGQNVGKTSLLEAVWLGTSDVDKYQQLPMQFRVAEGRDSQRYLQSVLGSKWRSIQVWDDQDRIVRTASSAHFSRGAECAVPDVRNDSIAVHRSIRGPKIQNGLDAVKGAISDTESPWDAISKVEFMNPLAVSLHLPDQQSAVQLFDQAILSRKKRQLLDMLHHIEPRLDDMHSLSPDGESRIYVELEGVSEALPLPQLGHGFARLVHLYCSLLVTQSKLALIDEIETGIHYSSLPTVFKGIQDIAVKHDVQTLMTTHSWDCIRAAYQTFAEGGNLKDFQLIRLERREDNVHAVVINDESLQTVMEAGYEVR